MQETCKIMLLNITFSNYRSFKEEATFTFVANTSKAKPENIFEVEQKNKSNPLRLLKRSLIYGANASGKTNVIRALFYLVKLIQGSRSSNQLYDPFKFDDDSRKAPVKISIDFLLKGVKYTYSVALEKGGVSKEELKAYPNNRERLIFNRKTVEDGAEINYGPTLKRGAAQKLKVFRDKLLLTQFYMYANDEDITPVANYLANIEVINGYNNKMLAELWKEVTDWLKENPSQVKRLTALVKASDIGIHNLKLNEQPLGNQDEIKFYHRKNENINTELTIANESYGTRLIFLIGGKMLQAMEKGSPIFIDEMDAGLHTYVTRWLLDLINSEKINTKRSQLLLTSHDINLLDEARIRRDQVWFTEKDENGVSELFSLADFDDVREGTPFAKWYMHNKFGAVPKIEDIEDLFESMEE